MPSTVSAPPPWRCRLSALVWWRLVADVADHAGQGAPRGWRGVGVWVGAVVDYADTPVGPYREVLSAVVRPGWPRPLVHVPFIAVDSEASQVAGRRGWALPKQLAAFAPGTATGTTGEWAVSPRQRAAPLGPVLAPVAVSATLAQATPDGVLETPVAVRGLARPALVDVQVRGEALVPAGRCAAARIRRGVLTIGRPR